jgi:ABC-type multidrug transport system fused ATPase/permease subunit
MASDKIVVMENGAVAESGTHEELLRKNGQYRRVYDIQSTFEAGEEVIPKVK